MYSNPPAKTQFLRSTAMRQTVVLLLVFAIITTIAWMGTYVLVVRGATQLVQQRLEALIASAADSLTQEASQLPVHPGHYLAIIKSGVIIDGTLPTGFSPAGKTQGYYNLESALNADRTDFIILISDTDTHRIVAAENVESLEETTDILLVGLQVSLAAALLAALVGGVLIARYNQRRLNRISQVLSEVSNGNLQSRVKFADNRDDISQLAGQINNTIGRLEATMAQVRVQSANIAHDLRTPLARFRAVLEERYIALTENNEPVSAEALTDALEQVDRLVDTFNALLRISRIESGDQKSSFVAVSLDEILDTVQDTFGPVIEDRNQTLKVLKSNPAVIIGDTDMLIQLIGNLIQNSLRYGQPQQQISLSVQDTTLTVTDQGTGIPVDERERVLQPLYQQERQRQGEGFGLGLALVNAICHLHDAQLNLADGPNDTGLSVSVKFPETVRPTK